MEPITHQAEPSLAIQRTAQGSQAEEAPQLQTEAGMQDASVAIIRATRSWIQYGTVGFAVTLIVIGALEGLLGR